jgi:polyhydroxyalkanoate synthesis regulator phasin
MEERNRRQSEQPIGEWARSEARDVADTARQSVHEAARGTKAYAAEAKDYVQDAVRQTKDYVAGAREYVEDTVQQARDKMSEYGEGGMEKVKRDVAGYTREQPMTALLIAAGAGLVLGWLSAARR